MPKVAIGYGAMDWHRREIVKAVRGLLNVEGTLEEALDLCVKAATDEYLPGTFEEHGSLSDQSLTVH
jgi:hypothetical protein